MTNEVTDKRSFEASRFDDPMKSIEIDTIRKVCVLVSTKRSTAWTVNVCFLLSNITFNCLY